MKLLSIVLFSTLTYSFAHKFETQLKTVSSQNYLEENSKSKEGIPFETKLADASSKGVPQDNGGNYGDLIYRFRENEDTLLLREVVLNEVLSSDEQDIRWTVSFSGPRVTSVRVLNFGRSRAYCLRIDVAAGDVQIFLRVPPLGDPRVMIEIYGI